MADISETLRSGVEHHLAGRLAEAEDMYRRVLKINPRHIQAVHLLGLVAFQLGRHDTAVEYLNLAIKADSFHAPLPADLAEIYRSMGKIPEAIASYRKSIDLNAEVPEAQNGLGTLLETVGDLDGAIECFETAVDLNPRYAEAHANLGRVLEAQGDFVSARAALEKTLELSPGNALAHLGLGNCAAVDGDWPAALERYQQAAALSPDSAEVHFALGKAQLALGNLGEGWRDFEWRLRCPSLALRSFPLPSWNGVRLYGHNVLVHAEGALGDTVQFIRFVSELIHRGGTPVLDVPAPLAVLLAQSGFENMVRPDEPAPECHLQAPLLSLPYILKLENLPTAPYLSASQQLVTEWSQKLSAVEGLKVGIVWQGNPLAVLDRFRSITLAEFQPLAALPGVRLISLQKQHGLDQLPAAVEQFKVIDLGAALDEAAGPFMDTAAIIANLDLVITCDSAVAHLAGALGAPVWVALSTASDWRWMHQRDDSPWYPSMRLFRQAKGERWAEVFQRMATALSQVAKARLAKT